MAVGGGPRPLDGRPIAVDRADTESGAAVDRGAGAVAAGGQRERASGPAAASERAAVVAERLEALRSRMADAGGDPERIRVVAVTKGFGLDVVAAALAAGLVDLGENYAQELLAKAPWVGEGCRWHYLGTIQRNKIRSLIPYVRLWQALDRGQAVRALAEHRPGARVLLQVNVVGDPRKGGTAPDDLDGLLGAATDAGLVVEGLMTVGPAGDRAGARRCFRQLRRLADGLGLEQRSMGMSNDFEEAVAEGATIVRLGRALFGPRPAPGRPDRVAAADRHVGGASL